MPTIGTFWKNVPLSPAAFRPSSQNCVAMYSAAMSPPRWPVPRPSRRSCERKRTCARICSGSIFSNAEIAAGGRCADARESWLVLRAACAMENTSRRIGGTIKASFVIQSSRKRWANSILYGKEEVRRKNAEVADTALPLHSDFLLLHSRLSTTCGLVDFPGAPFKLRLGGDRSSSE